MFKRAFFGAQLLATAFVGARLRHGASRRSPLEPVARGTHDVSVVIPARNEAARIKECVESIMRHCQVAEVIVVDDNSEDDTALIAQATGARVITAPPLPKGWVGKPWALQCGLEAAKAENIVFFDADVRLQADAVSVLVSELSNHDVVSLSARLVTSSLLDQALSASMVTSLVYRFGPVGRVTEPPPNRVMGNGQCLAFKRQRLVSEGGFALAAQNMTDDIALLRALAHRGLHIEFLDGSKLLDVEMYSSAKETWTQWPRSLPMNDTTTPLVRTLDVATLWLTMAVPLWRVLLGKSGVLDKTLLGVRVAMSYAVAGAFKPPRRAALLSPLLDLPITTRLTWTTLRPVRHWRGRRYTPEKIAIR